MEKILYPEKCPKCGKELEHHDCILNHVKYCKKKSELRSK